MRKTYCIIATVLICIVLASSCTLSIGNKYIPPSWVMENWVIINNQGDFTAPLVVSVTRSDIVLDAAPGFISGFTSQEFENLHFKQTVRATTYEVKFSWVTQGVTVSAVKSR